MPTRRLTLLGLAALACAACSTPPALAEGRLVDMRIVDRARGETLDVWRARGASWIAGRPGDRYAIRLTNRTPARVLVVLSVDGVNAVSGETAETGQTGYVLGPWQSADITGWRKSDRDAAAFYFTSLPDSYAARTDRPDNVGVIGAAVFRERFVRPTPPVVVPSPRGGESREETGSEPPASFADARAQGDSAAARPSAVPAPAPSADKARRDAPAEASANGALADRAERFAERERKLGTGHGEREYSPVSSTHFERATSQPAEVVQLRYDSWVNLRAAGIVPSGNRSVPQPFPGYVPDPRG